MFTSGDVMTIPAEVCGQKSPQVRTKSCESSAGGDNIVALVRSWKTRGPWRIFRGEADFTEEFPPRFAWASLANWLDINIFE